MNARNLINQASWRSSIFSSVSSIERFEQFLHDLPGSFFLHANKKDLHNSYHFMHAIVQRILARDLSPLDNQWLPPWFALGGNFLLAPRQQMAAAWIADEAGAQKCSAV